MAVIDSDGPSKPDGPTGQLCTWLASVKFTDLPSEVRERAKYLLLDGFGCLLIGSHLDWSELGSAAIADFEGAGADLIVASKRRTSPFSAALINSSFIQGFELDDYYPAAPVHSNSVIIPAVLPLLQRHNEVTGRALLAAVVRGYEVGTRVGLALHGPQMLSRGWHSGAVFGGPAAAASAGALLRFSAAQYEDALGIAATQAGGLMSAQFESMVKRMQHGFAARNGLYGAVLAHRGFVGIKQVFERDYGGFLGVFGEGHQPDQTQLTAGLGDHWNTMDIAVKPYAAMGALHAGIDDAFAIRGQRPVRPDEVSAILIEIGDAAYQHGGFPITRPIAPITAQMSVRYSVAVALLDGAALLQQFSEVRVADDDVWALIDRTDVHLEPGFDAPPHTGYTTRVTVHFTDGTTLINEVEMPTGGPGQELSNDDIEAKFTTLLDGVAPTGRTEQLRDLILHLEDQNSLLPLLHILEKPVNNALH